MVAVVSNQKYFSGVNPNRQQIISHFTDDRLASKLMAMGVLPGSKISLIRKAPMGGGWYIQVDNKVIAMREQEMGCIVTS